MAEPLERMFVPFGELKPDGKLFNNDGLVESKNAIPIYGGYIASQLWVRNSSFGPGTNEIYGLHVHSSGGSSWTAYAGESASLVELSTGYATTDKTRLVGGPYAASTNAEGWQGASFGDAVVMTDYVDDPQLLTSPAAGNFVKLAQSGGANPGMDPKAKFAWAQRGNMFLANLNLSAAFDGLPVGANPTAVCWSQTENIRQYGSFNATPQLTGTGYQPLSYDFGHITGGVGGDYGLVALQRGWVRCDGPPYVFRPIVVGMGCRYPNSIVRLDQDVYFWGPSGPSVLRGGEGPVVSLGEDKVVRTLIDNATGFSPTYSISSSVAVRHVSAAIDEANGLLFMSYTSSSADGSKEQVGDLCVVYSISDGRFGFIENASSSASPGLAFGVTMLRSLPDLGARWAPGRDLVGATSFAIGGILPRTWGVGIPNYGAAGAANPLLSRSYQQYDPQRVTRPIRIRPVFSRINLTSGLQVTVTISSKNRPYDAPVVTSSSTMDEHGWIVLPGSKLADFHQASFTFAGSDLVGSASHGPESIAELEGYEVEFAKGGAYGV